MAWSALSGTFCDSFQSDEPNRQQTETSLWGGSFLPPAARSGPPRPSSAGLFEVVTKLSSGDGGKDAIAPVNDLRT
jgi:hypothetical protein